MLKGNAIVGQSGGPTAAINATLGGVICGARECGFERLYGMRNGIEGLLEGRTVDLFDRVKTDDDLRRLECTPAAALGSCRKKLPADADDPVYTQLFDIFARLDIRCFFYIGGNDSMDTVDKLSAYAEKTGRAIRFMGVPKTIDNDLEGTDHTPGFGSAAKFVATTVQEIARDCAVYTVPAVTIVEIMGRDAGWLTAAAGLPGLYGAAGADLLCLPEVPFDRADFLATVRAQLAKKPNVVVAVSEGVRDADGRYVGEGAQSGVKDVFGHKYLAGTAKQLEQLVREQIGCKVRAVELSLPQRCAGHLLSKTDIEESHAVGAAAVRAAAAGATAAIAAIRRTSDAPYASTVVPVPVKDVANRIKKVPISEISGYTVSEKLLRRIAPLICGEVAVPFENGLPKHFVIEGEKR